MKRYVVFLMLFFFFWCGGCVYGYDDAYFIDAENGFLCGEAEDVTRAVSMSEGLDVNGGSISLRVIPVPIKVTRNSDGNYFMWSDISFISYNRRVGYCVDPLTKINKSANYNSIDYSKVLTAKKRAEILLIMYYGYSYPNHKTDDYYLATQKLIWESLDFTVKYYAKNSNFTGNYSVAKEEKEIKRLIADHHKSVSFDGKVVEMKIDDVVSLYDEQGVLKDYVVDVSGDCVDVKKDDNVLLLHALHKGELDICLRKGAKKLDDVVVLAHRSSGSQTFVSIVEGAVEPLVANVKVKVSGVGSIDVLKVDADSGLPLGGVAFVLASDEEFENIVGRGITNDNGHLVFNDLVSGSYYCREVECLSPYVLDDTVYCVDVCEDEVSSLVVENRKQQFRLRIQKRAMDEDVFLGSMASLIGAEYEVLDANQLTVVERVKAFDDVVEVQSLLDVDTYYYVKEVVAPKGMEVNEELIEVYVPYQKNVEDVVIEVSCFDDVIKNHIVIQKMIHSYQQDEVNIGVGCDFTFEIYNHQNQLVDVITTNEEGWAKSKELPYGQYTVKEVEKKGYTVIEPFTVMIDSANEQYIFDVVNEVIDYDIIIHKVDEDQNGLKGASFAISTSEDMRNVVMKKSSDEKGNLLFSHLLPNTYYVQEIQAPVGYVLDSTVYEIVVDTDVEYTFINQKKEVELVVKKVDEYQKPLVNAVFTLKDSFGNKQKQVSNEEGIAKFTVSYGEYMLEEIVAPDGYEKLEHPLKIVVDQKALDEGIIVEVVNHKLEIVDTADNQTIPIFTLGMSVVLLFVFVWMRKYS